MSLTRIGSIGINTGIAFAGVTTIVTLNTANDALSIGATVNVGSGITLGASGDIFATGVSTVTTLKVGSGVTVSSDGDIFATGVCTATSFSGSGANLTGIDTDLVSDTSPQLGGNLDVNTKNIVFGDSGGATDDRLTFGAGTDLSIYHNGSDSYIEDSGTGALVVKTSQLSIRNAADDEQLAKFIQDSSVELYHNNSKKFETSGGGGTLTGDFTVTGNIYGGNHITIQDSDGASDMLKIGAGEDLRIYHYNNNSYIRQHSDLPLIIGGTSTGQSLYLQPKDGENSAIFKPNGAVELYHDNVKKFETHDVGTIFTEAGSGTTQAAIKVNTTLDTYGSVTVRDKRDVDNAVAAFQVENASNGSDETNLLLRSVNLGTTAFAHGIYAARSHRFAVSSNTTPTVQIDSHGLKFGNDQAEVNALDDYEEGSWTPQLRFGNVSGSSYATQAGSYTKIGNLVTFSFRISLSAKGSQTGSAQVYGLPFNVANGDDNYSSAQFGYLSNVNNQARWSCLQLPVLDTNTNYIFLRRLQDDSTNAQNHTQSDFTDSFDMIMNGFYYVS